MGFNVVILGTGNVGHHLACAFSAAGHHVFIWNRTVDNAKNTASICGAQIIEQPEVIAQDTDLCIISLNEDSIASVCKRIPRFNGTLVHTAGSVPIDILTPYAENYGVFYPLQTFRKERTLNYSSIPVFIEGSDNHALKLLHKLASGIFGTVTELDSMQRSYLHLAAVFACNFINASLMAAQQISETYSIDFNHLLPLIEETIAKNKTGNPSTNQTGPAVRNNIPIIDKHIKMLENQAELQSFYMAVTHFIQKKFNNNE